MIPNKLNNIIKDLQKQNWVKSLLVSGRLYLVGGSIRDAYRNEDIKDIDIIVEKLSMSQIINILFPFGQVNKVGESFAVLKFKPIGYQGEDYDISIPRTDTKIGDGHKGFLVNTEGVSIYEDLKRRDFTINSIAINIETENLIDPYNGIRDIENRTLRATDKTAFIEDPLRILRGIGFSARFGYNIDTQTLKLMKENSHLIKKISGERIMDELMKIINKNGNTQIALTLLHKTNIDLALFNKKMIYYDRGFEYLDVISFFYVLGLLGDINPSDFVLNHLKGEYKLAKNLSTLEKVFKNLPNVESNREEFLFMLSKAFSESPDIMEAVILPDSISEVILQMRLGKIPLSLKKIKINGDDIIEISNGTIQGKDIGILLDRILKDALMNKFNWKNRKTSMEYLIKLVYGN